MNIYSLKSAVLKSRLLALVVAVLFFAVPYIANAAEVWLTAQAPLLGSGSGTQTDPYDASTAAKFDALMTSFQNTQNLIIHLGSGTFRSDSTADNRWLVQPGWKIEGTGMNSTTCQMAGNLAGKHWDMQFFKSAFNASTDGVVIQDLTVDCNWAELGQTADVGADGEKFGSIFAIQLSGNNIVIQRVRHINSYGSRANANEAFGITIGTPNSSDASGNTIRDCRAELPQGNYGAPYGLFGWASENTLHYQRNSKVYNNYAIGNTDGKVTGFTTGGVNAAYLKNCQIYGNTFVDCQSIFYQDTGSVDGLQVTGNSLTRGWVGIGLIASAEPSWTKADIKIADNTINLQNRLDSFGSASYGIWLFGANATGINISGNRISFDTSGQGYRQFLTISAAQTEQANISDNQADEQSVANSVDAETRGQVVSYDTTIVRNKRPAGGFMTGLSDKYLAPLAKALNFSTRAVVGTGDNVLINGFIVGGSKAKKVIVRAIGPSLAASGVRGAMVDPTIALYDSTGKMIASNDDWRASSQQAAIIATKIQPLNDREAALIATLPAGTYTAVMSGKGSGTGVGLVEVYDLSPSADSSLQNVSTRGLVGTGDNVIIGGFIVGEGQHPTMVVRGIGPSLFNAGIRNALRDPMLELHNSNGATIASNDNWRQTQQDAIKATGLAPTNDREAALMIQLPPGSYTTILRGVHNTSGVGLVEVYRTQ